MSIATPAVTNFTAGEISPRLEGRVDLSKYFKGCRVLENFHIHPHGCITRRPGFRFVAEALNSDNPVLLIPFEYNAVQTYVLEFGEDIEGQGRNIRVRRDGLLAAYDWTQLADGPLAKTDKAAWAAYRQALRDLPQQSGFPDEVAWPPEPAA